ncbi:hypothetical protein HMI54_012556 [Coelomomyces lativittatus]|nr:hypothetical protein HMI55_000766 [Coelomomyces lativittatus]KAJ1514163.1 hypothetical protein HMI56_001045 [Coelomomyces lativittatus]KAJ1518673.1 hypothetical protein HMI54_012556 [Coelomomyces lativittatus]
MASSSGLRTLLQMIENIHDYTRYLYERELNTSTTSLSSSMEFNLGQAPFFQASSRETWVQGGTRGSSHPRGQALQPLPPPPARRPSSHGLHPLPPSSSRSLSRRRQHQHQQQQQPHRSLSRMSRGPFPPSSRVFSRSRSPFRSRSQSRSRSRSRSPKNKGFSYPRRTSSTYSVGSLKSTYPSYLNSKQKTPHITSTTSTSSSRSSSSHGHPRPVPSHPFDDHPMVYEETKRKYRRSESKHERGLDERKGGLFSMSENLSPDHPHPHPHHHHRRRSSSSSSSSRSKGPSSSHSPSLSNQLRSRLRYRSTSRHTRPFNESSVSTSFKHPQTQKKKKNWPTPRSPTFSPRADRNKRRTFEETPSIQENEKYTPRHPRSPVIQPELEHEPGPNPPPFDQDQGQTQEEEEDDIEVIDPSSPRHLPNTQTDPTTTTPTHEEGVPDEEGGLGMLNKKKPMKNKNEDGEMETKHVSLFATPPSDATPPSGWGKRGPYESRKRMKKEGREAPLFSSFNSSSSSSSSSTTDPAWGDSTTSTVSEWTSTPAASNSTEPTLQVPDMGKTVQPHDGWGERPGFWFPSGNPTETDPHLMQDPTQAQDQKTSSTFQKEEDPPGVTAPSWSSDPLPSPTSLEIWSASTPSSTPSSFASSTSSSQPPFFAVTSETWTPLPVPSTSSSSSRIQHKQVTQVLSMHHGHRGRRRDGGDSEQGRGGGGEGRFFRRRRE